MQLCDQYARTREADGRALIGNGYSRKLSLDPSPWQECMTDTAPDSAASSPSEPKASANLRPGQPARSAEGYYRLSDAEIDELRREMLEAAEWAREQLAIDPELKHL